MILGYGTTGAGVATVGDGDGTTPGDGIVGAGAVTAGAMPVLALDGEAIMDMAGEDLIIIEDTTIEVMPLIEAEEVMPAIEQVQLYEEDQTWHPEQVDIHHDSVPTVDVRMQVVALRHPAQHEVTEVEQHLEEPLALMLFHGTEIIDLAEVPEQLQITIEVQERIDHMALLHQQEVAVRIEEALLKVEDPIFIELLREALEVTNLRAERHQEVAITEDLLVQVEALAATEMHPAEVTGALATVQEVIEVREAALEVIEVQAAAVEALAEALVAAEVLV
ncbi:MAG: hypothetical protein AB3N18_11005 [Allomuricauda sp.]